MLGYPTVTVLRVPRAPWWSSCFLCLRSAGLGAGCSRQQSADVSTVASLTWEGRSPPSLALALLPTVLGRTVAGGPVPQGHRCVPCPGTVGFTGQEGTLGPFAVTLAVPPAAVWGGGSGACF